MTDDIAERLRRRMAWWKDDCEDLREAADEITRLREEAKIFREGFDGLTRGNQELQSAILRQEARIVDLIATQNKLLTALRAIALSENEKSAKAIAVELMDELYGDI